MVEKIYVHNVELFVGSLFLFACFQSTSKRRNQTGTFFSDTSNDPRVSMQSGKNEKSINV